ncbi:MAG TPA: GntR family transcriptional regulator [Pirellulales bacterium]|nr:GntR family transcriptional regulator [Pirellulales bacterium]
MQRLPMIKPARLKPVKARPIRCDHGLRRQAIVESLLREVFQGRLRAGQHLGTQELAERFGVSHTPIREALVALAGTGVIDLLPNRGAVVRRVTGRDVREICQVRRALECEAVRRACGRIDPLELSALAAEFQRLQRVKARQRPKYLEEARRLDSRLHDLIAGSCGNGFLAKEIGRLKTLFRAFRDVSWEHDQAHNGLQRLTEESHEHLAILQALLAADRKQAARLMSEHIRSGARYWSRVVSETAVNPLVKPSISRLSLEGRTR